MPAKQDELCYRWSLPKSAVTLLVPVGQYTDTEWDEIEDFIKLSLRTARRCSKPTIK